MGKKRSTKATAGIQSYVGPELPDTPEQRETDQDQAKVSPTQQSVASPSETAAESAKSPNRRLKSIFRDPMPELARKMQADIDKQISDCWQKLQATSEPWWELPDTPEQREVDQNQPTVSTAQEAVPGPSEITVSPAQDDSEWPRFSDTARRLVITKTTFYRMLEKGEFLDNGKKGRQRRIDPSSILDYCKRTGTTYNEK